MITQDQIINLSKEYQIDTYSIFREYLQLVFLSYFYQEKDAREYFFKGGTALRLLFGSPRFSEDLDFSTLCGKDKIETVLAKVTQRLQAELPGLKTKKLYEGKEGLRYQLSYLDPNFKYPVNIRLDFHQQKLVKHKSVSVLTTRFPIMIFPQVFHLSGEGILAEKITAIGSRSKGRDLFDTWFLLARGIKHPKIGGHALKNLKNFPQKRLETDLAKFLPQSQKGIIPTLKLEILKLV